MMMPGACNVDLVEQLDRAGPYGQGASAPRFAITDARVAYARQVGSGHLKLTLDDGLGARLDAIAFNAFDGPLGQALSAGAAGRFHLAGRLEINEWGGRRSVQLRLDDAAPAQPPA